MLVDLHTFVLVYFILVYFILVYFHTCLPLYVYT